MAPLMAPLMLPRVLADLPPPEATAAPTAAPVATPTPSATMAPSASASASPAASPVASPAASATAPGVQAKGPAVLPELQSGEKLLVEAYAVMWALAFAFLLLMIRRQRSADERLARLEGALAAHAKAPKATAARDAKGRDDEG